MFQCHRRNKEILIPKARNDQHRDCWRRQIDIQRNNLQRSQRSTVFTTWGLTIFKKSPDGGELSTGAVPKILRIGTVFKFIFDHTPVSFCISSHTSSHPLPSFSKSATYTGDQTRNDQPQWTHLKPDLSTASCPPSTIVMEVGGIHIPLFEHFDLEIEIQFR